MRCPRGCAAVQQRLVEVRLAKKTSGPVDVRLETRCGWAIRPRLAMPFELAGFEVVGAAAAMGIHRGHGGGRLASAVGDRIAACGESTSCPSRCAARRWRPASSTSRSPIR